MKKFCFESSSVCKCFHFSLFVLNFSQNRRLYCQETYGKLWRWVWLRIIEKINQLEWIVSSQNCGLLWAERQLYYVHIRPMSPTVCIHLLLLNDTFNSIGIGILNASTTEQQTTAQLLTTNGAPFCPIEIICRNSKCPKRLIGACGKNTFSHRVSTEPYPKQRLSPSNFIFWYYSR